MWKSVVDTDELKTFECNKSGLQVCIEARSNKHFWEIYKTYRSQNITFTEEYEATSNEEAKRIISRMKSEIIDKKMVDKIDYLRKNLQINVRRVFKNDNVEKWKFSVNSDHYTNVAIIRYGIKDVEMDIIADEQYRFIETELLDELFRVLGMNDFAKEVIQNIYFFSKKSSFYNDIDEKELLNKIEVGFRFETESDDTDPGIDPEYE